MVREMPKLTCKKKITSQEDLYKAQLAESIKKNGRDSLETGLALLELAKLYDRNSDVRDSEPLWREIEVILAKYVKKHVLSKTA